MKSEAEVHAWCVEALPRWLDGALAAGDAAALNGHVRQCAACRGELDLARRVRRQFDDEWRAVAPLLEADRERAQFDRLWTRISAVDGTNAQAANVAPSQPAASPQEGSLHAASRSVSRQLAAQRRRYAPVWGALAATVLLGSSAAWYRGATQPDFRTLADQPPQRCIALHVQVDATAGASVRRALESTGATVVESRSGGDTYVLTAPNPAEALTALRALPDVRRADPVDC